MATTSVLIKKEIDEIQIDRKSQKIVFDPSISIDIYYVNRKVREVRNVIVEGIKFFKGESILFYTKRSPSTKIRYGFCRNECTKSGLKEILAVLRAKKHHIEGKLLD